MSNRVRKWPSAKTTKSLPEDAWNVISRGKEAPPVASGEILIDVLFDCRKLNAAQEVQFTTVPAPKEIWNDI